MIDKEKEEIWKTYPDYPFVEVSNLGRVRTKDRVVKGKDGKKYHIKGKFLKQQLNPNGYMYVDIKVDRKTVHLRVNRMVAITFIPNPHNYPVVNHIDNDKTNNSVSNLEWCTRKYNEAYKKNFGTSPAQIQGTPVIAVNPETSDVLWFESQHEAARQLSVSQGNMNEVIKGKRNSAGGFWFTYADENAVDKVKVKFGDNVARKVEELMNENCN